MRSAGLGVGYALSVRVPVALFLACIISEAPLAEARQAGTQTISPITAAFCEDMRTHHVISTDVKVGCDRLRLVRFSYFGFDGNIHDDGEMVVMDAAATHVLRIFERLR